MFEAIETALKDTIYDSLVEEMFFGVQTSFITCTVCGNKRDVREKFLDLPLQVQGIKDVNDSLKAYFTPEMIEGVNCEVCEKPTTMSKGPLLTRLPPVLQFNLTRIAYDMTTWDRIKVNDVFEYPLELNLEQYLEESDEAQAQKQDPDLCNYELKAIVIHRGGPYGGHYHAYIRDDLNEGNWNLQLPLMFDAAPVDVEPKEAEKKPDEDKKDGDAEEEKEEDIDWDSLDKK